jgi:hypothetical protein
MAAVPAVPGTARATRHSYLLPPESDLAELKLDLTVALAPDRSASSDHLVLYVLDPEPVLVRVPKTSAHTSGGALLTPPHTPAAARS